MLRGENEIESATDQYSNRGQADGNQIFSFFAPPPEGVLAAITALEEGARATCWLDSEVGACACEED